MAPTILNQSGYRVYFYSDEEDRMHVHVGSAGTEVKVWLEPEIEIAQNLGMTKKQIREVLELVTENERKIRTAWKKHFGQTR